jgi:hypothetical protein
MVMKLMYCILEGLICFILSQNIVLWIRESIHMRICEMDVCL